MKRFVFGSLLRKLPLFIILTVVLASVAIFSASSPNFIVKFPVGRNGHYYFENGESTTSFISLLIFFTVVMVLLPLFSMNYRYSIAKSDVYRQAAFKNKSIRYAEHLSTLIITLISFTFAYIVLVGILAFRNVLAEVPNNPRYYDAQYDIGILNYFYYLPLYFFIIFFGVTQYFISYLFVSRSNSIRNSIILLIISELAITSLSCLLTMFINNNDSYNATFAYIGQVGASPALPIVTIITFFNPAILYSQSFISTIEDAGVYTGNAYIIFMFIFNFLIYFSLVVLGLVAFLKEKDPSGEFAGKANTKKPYQEVIFHVGIAIFGAFFAGNMLLINLLSYFLFLVLFSAAYYSLYGTLIHNFKLKSHQIITLIAVICSIVIVSICVYGVVNYYNYQ